jgi:opacity protein-like surface antigen
MKEGPLNMRKMAMKFGKSSTFLIWAFVSLISPVQIARCMSVSDSASLPFMFSFGAGADFDWTQRKFDYDSTSSQTINSLRILGSVNYSFSDQFGAYAKIGLQQADTLNGQSSDWGPGVGLGVRGYAAEFMDGDIRLGFDAQIYRAEMDFSRLDKPLRYSYDENIVWMEYQASALLSWRAYSPLNLYTGVQFSFVDLDHDIRKLFWASDTVVKDSIHGDESQFFALMWGVDYQLIEKVQLFAELRAMSEISAAFGFQFTIF